MSSADEDTNLTPTRSGDGPFHKGENRRGSSWRLPCECGMGEYQNWEKPDLMARRRALRANLTVPGAVNPDETGSETGLGATGRARLYCCPASELISSAYNERSAGWPVRNYGGS